MPPRGTGALPGLPDSRPGLAFGHAGDGHTLTRAAATAASRVRWMRPAGVGVVAAEGVGYGFERLMEGATLMPEYSEFGEAIVKHMG